MIAFIPEHTICSAPIENSYPMKNFDSSQEYLWERYHEACTPLGLTFVKRVIGKEGDEITYRNKEILVNGVKLNREFIGIELDGNAYDISKERIENYVIQKVLF